MWTIQDDRCQHPVATVVYYRSSKEAVGRDSSRGLVCVGTSDVVKTIGDAEQHHHDVCTASLSSYGTCNTKMNVYNPVGIVKAVAHVLHGTG